MHHIEVNINKRFWKLVFEQMGGMYKRSVPVYQTSWDDIREKEQGYIVDLKSDHVKGLLYTPAPLVLGRYLDQGR